MSKNKNENKITVRVPAWMDEALKAYANEFRKGNKSKVLREFLEQGLRPFTVWRATLK